MIQDLLLRFVDFSNQSPWIGIFLILAVAIATVTLIAFATHRSIRGVASAAADALSQAQGVRRSSPEPHAFTSVGHGEVEWHPGGYTSTFRRRMAGVPDGPAPEEDEAGVRLEIALEEIGFDTRDVMVDHVLEPGQGTPLRTLVVKVRVRNPSWSEKVAKAAQSANFLEDKSGVREEITLDDAHREAGARAIEDALSNITVLRETLGLDSNLALVGAEIETLARPKERRDVIAKVARTRWSASA